MSIVQKLTEGIVNRDLSAEGAALISKWENTGLLEGISDDGLRNGMARLLENQAKELLRESSSMSAGDVEGFAAVAFPLVRRVFGNLIANDLVSVQPMSLPSGLIFFLDFTISGQIGGRARGVFDDGYPSGSSIYGGNVVGAQLTGGVNLTGAFSEDGPYALNNGYSSPTSSLLCTGITIVASGTVSTSSILNFRGAAALRTEQSLLEFDADLPSGTTFAVATVPLAQLVNAQLNTDDLITLAPTGAIAGAPAAAIRRSLTRRDPNAPNTTLLVTLVDYAGGQNPGQLSSSLVPTVAGAGTGRNAFYFTITDNFAGAGAPVGAVLPTSTWGLEGSADIPEIDIKVDSVSVTAITKKLKAKWTPELGQDLNAYHNLDAEVELTQILSEQIALEIDQEILEDLRIGARAGVKYWSRNPGQFVNRDTGTPLAAGTADFTGNVSEWYETLVETINEVSAAIHRKTLRGAANFVVCGPEVANILEFTAGFRANVTADDERGDAGAVKVGSLSKKFDIFVDAYFPRQVLLVGRRGSSFLESGYVYAPYVPLQTTPTIFGVEDFVPRKGVMTRYAKKMVRPDMYGLVIVRGLV
tara:strand:- start:30644 stop:32401 length:1758 start_codon:yes stop_codon:yes gene_type:complete